MVCGCERFGLQDSDLACISPHRPEPGWHGLIVPKGPVRRRRKITTSQPKLGFAKRCRASASTQVPLESFKDDASGIDVSSEEDLDVCHRCFRSPSM